MCFILCCMLAVYTTALLALLVLLICFPGVGPHIPTMLAWGWDFSSAMVTFFGNIALIIGWKLSDVVMASLPVVTYICKNAIPVLQAVCFQLSALLEYLLPVFSYFINVSIGCLLFLCEMEWSELVDTVLECFHSPNGTLLVIVFSVLVIVLPVVLYRTVGGDWEQYPIDAVYDRREEVQNQAAAVEALRREHNNNIETEGTPRDGRQEEPSGQNRDLRDEQEGFNYRACVVCFERDRDTALFPCGHTQLCGTCTRQIRQQTNLCPLCQQRIREHRHVFV